jgi:repressor LexA
MESSRPTKKQRELLSFIDGFIKGNGYGPSYREIMRALEYKSVSTVAVHVDGLITRGFLIKKDNSARSLAIVGSVSAEVNPHEKWLKEEIRKRKSSEDKKEEIETLVKAAKILGFSARDSK